MELTSTLNIFKNLRGEWSIHRSLTCEPGYGFSGTLDGTASFKPRKPSSSAASLELLYTEQGDLKTDTGLTLSASRKYIYRYSKEEDRISAWFVKEETKDRPGKEEVEDHFMDIEIEEKEGLTFGRGEHLCSRDMYWAEYQWRVEKSTEEDEDEDEAEIHIWGLRYKVKGPQKDYISQTSYQRSDP